MVLAYPNPGAIGLRQKFGFGLDFSRVQWKSHPIDEKRGTMSIADITVTTIQGSQKLLSDYSGQVLLIVNTASQCGFTPQLAGLQQLYDAYKDRGFAVLGFPCNQFRSQEPGGEAEIASFCQLNYGVTFPMFEKIEVNGPNQHPLFRVLKREARGPFRTQAVLWNFTKFLVDRDGRVVKRFSPTTRPEAIERHIRKLLQLA